MQRYGKTRAVSDPLASRNATIKMIQRCAKHQPQAEDFGRASHTDLYAAYTTWGSRAEEHGPLTPALAIKVVDDMYIQKKLFPTQPVPLVPSDWIFTKDGGWEYCRNYFDATFYSNPLFAPPITADMIRQFNEAMRRMWENAPPPVAWFSLREPSDAAEPQSIEVPGESYARVVVQPERVDPASQTIYFTEE